MKTLKSENRFLGVVKRDRSIYMPWRGTNVSIKHHFCMGQNLLVYFDRTDNYAEKVELPTLEQLKEMKEELDSDWSRFAEIFDAAPAFQRVLLLRAMDRVMRSSYWTL